MNKNIEKAISICGSQENLAKACGVTQMAISKWLYGGGINAKYISLISKATGGQVTESELLKSLSED
ncbi:transcriptional regulator [Histophilus somni]|uniref:transcriptional regulator n=1 Tax=Histophilus somni TaxID=731 RepID=UPI00094AEAF9|nr:YdaS family helix-turn-helix protein [Histophilus somni]